MPGSGGESNEVERLKSLLFSAESHRLAEAEGRLDGLEGWVGDAGRLEAATAEILVAAFQRAEVARHRELAAAVAPVVVAAIRSEIHNSRDMMVEALYPITGRLVAAAVSNAFKDLIATINQRLDAALSAENWRLRVKSVVTGRPLAELALAEALGVSFVRLLLLERGSGRLLAHWGADGPADENPDLVSGMIAAITEFATTVLNDRGGELRTLDLGASQIYLRASQRVILAGELVGAASRDDMRRMEGAFLDLVERHDRGATVDADELSAFARTVFPPQSAPRRGSSAPAMILGALLLIGLGYWLYTPLLHAWKDRAIDAAFRQARAADPELADYPLRWRVDWSAIQLDIRGLAGSAPSVPRLAQAMAPAAAPLAIATNVRVVASAEDAASARDALAEAQRRIEALNARLEEAARTRQTEIAAADAGIATLAAKLDDGSAAAKARLDGLAAQLDQQAGQSRTANAALDAGVAASAARIEALRADLAALSGRIDDVAARAANPAEIQTRLDGLQQGVADLRSALSAPEREIATAARTSALFFGEHDEFADPAAAAHVLDGLADAIRSAGLGVRVVGYADESGSPAANVDVSRQRAEKVARGLQDRGVPAARLVVVGRGAQSPIVDSMAPNHVRNRRVVFEPLFPAEAAP